MTPPTEFGSDYDDHRTPAPPVAVPHTKHCEVRPDQSNFDPYRSTYTPGRMSGPWSKVVLRMHGEVKGVHDRLGHITIGGVGVFRTSTPEPSTDGIAWDVQKDVTAYIPLLRTPQPVVMELGNVVDDTYTGVLDITVTLDSFTWPGAGSGWFARPQPPRLEGPAPHPDPRRTHVVRRLAAHQVRS